MPIVLRTVSRSGSTIRFTDRVNDKALRDFIPALYEGVNRGLKDFSLDFSRASRAYADAILNHLPA